MHKPALVAAILVLALAAGPQITACASMTKDTDPCNLTG